MVKHNNLQHNVNLISNNQAYDLNFIDDQNRDDDDPVTYKLLGKDNSCNYYEISEMKDNIPTCQYDFRVMHYNIRSMPKNFESFKMKLAELDDEGFNFDFILLCETFLSDKNYKLFNIDGYSKIEKHRKTMQHGGVALFISNSYQFKVREDLSIFNEGQFESIFIEVSMNNEKSIIVGEIYRVPNSDQKEFLESYDKIVSIVTQEKKDLIIGTDQNLDLLKSDVDKITKDFLNYNYSKGILPVINKPTRITHTSATLIDNLYINNKYTDSYKSGIIVTDMSDHLPIFAFCGLSKPKTKKEPLIFNCRQMKESNISNMKNSLSEIDWTFLMTKSAAVCFEAISEEITSALDQFCPIKTVVIPYKKIIHEPWMTKGLLKSSISIDRLYKKSLKKDKNGIEYANYKKHLNLYNSLKRKAKSDYYTQSFSDCIDDSSRTWRLLNRIIGKQNDKSGTYKLFKINGVITSDLNEIAQGFCKYFTDVGKTFAAKIPRSNCNYSQYLGKVNKKVNQSIFFAPTTEDEILRIIKGLPSKKSFGHDKISGILLKHIAAEIKYPLSIAINKSITEGHVPNSLKIAKVVPIYKSKDKDSFSNYRPVSVLPVISKVLEKVIHTRTYKFLNQAGILYSSQYGFREGHSTSHAITELISNVLNAYEKKEFTLAVFLDLSKAFDTIDHCILLKKLEYYGIRGIALEWFASYLSDRQQYVEYNGVASENMTITCGVPQGSVLGPLLFILYMNDIASAIQNSNGILFADDTTIHASGSDINQLYRLMNRDLSIISDWFKANKLSLNVSKTYYVLFKNRYLHVPQHDNILALDGAPLSPSDTVKFLGIFLDSNLEWESQVKYMESKIASALYIMNRVKHILPMHAMKLLYYSLVYSHLSNGIMHWSIAYDKITNHLKIMQNDCLRIINKAKYRTSADKFYKTCKILKISDIAKLEMLKFVYNFVHGNLPRSLLNLFNFNYNVHEHNTRQSSDPHAEHSKSSLVSNSFLRKGPDLWGHITNDMKSSVSLKSFTNKIKKDIISKY